MEAKVLKSFSIVTHTHPHVLCLWTYILFVFIFDPFVLHFRVVDVHFRLRFISFRFFCFSLFEIFHHRILEIGHRMCFFDSSLQNKTENGIHRNKITFAIKKKTHLITHTHTQFAYLFSWINSNSHNRREKGSCSRFLVILLLDKFAMRLSFQWGDRDVNYVIF